MMIANRLTMRAAVIRPTLSLPTSEDDPFAPVADLSILGSTIHRAMPCVVWEDTERAANSDGQIIVRSIYAGQALPDTDIGEGDEIVGITRFGTALVLPRLQVRSAVSGVTHIGLTLDAISSTASGASVALYDYLATRAGGRLVSRAGGELVAR